jgi:uncharacterized protein
MRKLSVILIAAVLLTAFTGCAKKTAYKALILTGQGDGNWKVSSKNIRNILAATDLFSVSVALAPSKGSGTPDFGKYNLVVLGYSGDEWSEAAKSAFVNYVREGGGLLISGSAGSAFNGWKEFNDMCGFSVPAGNGGKVHDFEVRNSRSDNPVLRGLPVRWMHAPDILNSSLTGPAENTEVLASAFSDTLSGGSGKVEPVIIAVTYGKGRVFHTTLGHAEKEDDPSLSCAGFITMIQRGAEWAATGEVKQTVPFDFPSAAATSVRYGVKPLTIDEDFHGLASYQVDKSTKYLTDIQTRLRAAKGNAAELGVIEKKMAELLGDPKASTEGKKLILRELSWMGTDISLSAIKALATDSNLSDEVQFALDRLGVK